MSEAVKGRSRAEIERLYGEVHALLTGRAAAGGAAELGKLAALAGVAEFPARVKCASLCWHTLHAALERAEHAGIDGVNAMRSLRERAGRDPCATCEAVMVPSRPGRSRSRLGLAGYITQALGGSFTLYVEGNLYRLSGEQADAIGKEVVRPPRAAARCHRGGRARARLGADARLLRSGDPDQHRRSRPGV